MFDTGRRSMESVLLEHVGHDIELLEFTEDSRNGIELWCNTCGEPIIKHFIQGVWESDQTTRQTQTVSAPLWDVGESDGWET